MISANAHFLIAAVLSLAGADEKPRVDLYGDPLPEGAVLRLGTVRLRHPGVLAIAFSADGRKLISFGGDRVIRTWDPVTGRQMEDKPLPEVYDTPVAALSPDGNWLAFRDTSNKKGLYLWDVQKHQLAHKFLLKASCWDSPVAFSLDGATLVTTQKDGDVRAWDVKSGNAKLVGHLDGDIQHLSFARDGKLMTINKDPQGAPDSVKIRVWNLRDNTEPLTINLKMGLIQFQVDAHISPDAKFIAIRDLWSNSLSFWDTSTGKKANDWKSPEAPAYGVPRFSPDGKTTFIGTDNVVMWDPIEGKATRTLPGGTSANLIVSPDGKTAAATAADGYDAVVYLWDLTGGRRSPANDPERGHLDRVDAVALSKDGRTIATGSSRGVFLWDASTGRSLRKLSELATPDALTFSQDGRFLFVMTGEWIDQFDIASGEKIRCFAPEKAQVGLSEMNLSIDGKRLVALGYTGSPGDCRCLFITWEVSSGKLLRSSDFSQPQLLARGCFDSANSRLSTLGGHILDVETGKEVARLSAGEWRFIGLETALSRDGTLFAANLGKPIETADGYVFKEFAVGVWEVATHQPVFQLETARLRHLQFTPDGTRLIATDADKIHVWDLVSEKEIFRRSTPFRLRYVNSFASALALSNDGRKVATGLPDTTVLLWDLPAPVKAKATPLTPAEFEQSWADMAGADARRAFLATRRLASAPDQFIPGALKRLKPAKAPAKDEIKQLLTDLDDPSFQKRDAAAKRLSQFGPEADVVLRAVMPARPSLELERRLEKHFAARSAVMKGEDLLYVRAVRVLEEINSPDARKLLQVLADGAADAWRTRAAQAALK